MMSCKDTCKIYKATKFPNGRYGSGLKRCNSCAVFLDWDGLWCPCCGVRLRVFPRSRKYKEKLRELQRI